MITIKFRAWDNFNECYYYSDNYKNLAKFFDFCQQCINAENQLIFERFTGLHDKNGKEIYEGDIIGDWVEVDGKMEQSKLTVFFDEMLGQWMLDNSFNQDRTLSYALFAELKDFEYEVIGSIYENPELLND